MKTPNRRASRCRSWLDAGYLSAEWQSAYWWKSRVICELPIDHDGDEHRWKGISWSVDGEGFMEHYREGAGA